MFRDWRGAFYPEGLPQRAWLEHYAGQFGTVEINNTFYRLPSVSTVEGWVERTPADFRFAVKAGRYLTHIKRLQIEGRLERFQDRLRPMIEAGKLAVTLWQMPEAFHRDDERLEGALRALGDEFPGRHALEFRHASWFCEDVYARLRSAGVALVVADDPEMTFATRELTAPFTYVRFHRGSRGRKGNYSDAEIETWRRRIAGWRARTEVFAYFNNDWEAFAVRNARRLDSGLTTAGRPPPRGR
jgi:uncharacterized protein YecE (DUF72 family)